jgi:hypothetical protein
MKGRKRFFTVASDVEIFFTDDERMKWVVDVFSEELVAAAEVEVGAGAKAENQVRVNARRMDEIDWAYFPPSCHQ